MPGWIVETITTPTPAAVGVTGGTPTITATQNAVIAPEPVELVITGGQPLSGPVAVPSGAALTITGGTPTVTQDRLLTPAAAGITITGGQPSVTQLTHLTPAAATIAVTGGQPTITNQSPAAYNTVAAGSVGASGVANFTITASTGADIFVSVSWDRSGGSVSNVTCGGVTMTQIASIEHNNTSANGTLRLYRLAGAGNGTAKTISVSSSGSMWIAASAISFTGVPTTLTPVTNYGSGATASQSVTLTGSVGLLVLSSGAGGAATGTYSGFTGMTNRSNQNANGTQLTQNTVTTSGTVSATSSSSTPWASVFVPF
ncbi:minor tail protein [Mycobacterium phage Demsculpinboyz]|uniref:Minor tail protein n=1 Tax=Mycobacterium phage Demsculpinboyz TaxID=2041528 RepID=A0A2D1G9Q9_9CAUD|nr:minor tail protein [Mycobacterium phage Demsculpinboyz]ATN88621.1 minor tail protein [Mycobacterium phage Demsculpinboyz]